MSKNSYALETNGKNRLEISWEGWRYFGKQLTVSLDGKLIGVISDQKALSAGQNFSLPDGSAIRVQLVKNVGIQVHRNGQLLYDSVLQPQTPPKSTTQLKTTMIMSQDTQQSIKCKRWYCENPVNVSTTQYNTGGYCVRCYEASRKLGWFFHIQPILRVLSFPFLFIGGIGLGLEIRNFLSSGPEKDFIYENIGTWLFQIALAGVLFLFGLLLRWAATIDSFSVPAKDVRSISDPTLLNMGNKATQITGAIKTARQSRKPVEQIENQKGKPEPTGKTVTQKETPKIQQDFQSTPIQNEHVDVNFPSNAERRSQKKENIANNNYSSKAKSLFRICPKCRMKVLPKSNGTCPSCQSKIM